MYDVTNFLVWICSHLGFLFWWVFFHFFMGNHFQRPDYHEAQATGPLGNIRTKTLRSSSIQRTPNARPSGMHQNSIGTEAVLKRFWSPGTSVTNIAMMNEMSIARGSHGLRRAGRIGSAWRMDMRLLRTDKTFPHCMMTRVTK